MAGRIAGFAFLIGAVLAVYTGYLLVRGPFLEGPPLGTVETLVALAGFIVGLLVGSWGLNRLEHVLG